MRINFKYSKCFFDFFSFCREIFRSKNNRKFKKNFVYLEREGENREKNARGVAISTKQRAPLFPPSIMANEHGRNPRSSLRFPFIDTCPTIFHELPPTDYLFQLYHQPLRSEKTTGRTYQMWPLWSTRTIKRSSPFFSFFCFFLVPSPDSKRFIP